MNHNAHEEWLFVFPLFFDVQKTLWNPGAQLRHWVLPELCSKVAWQVSMIIYDTHDHTTDQWSNFARFFGNAGTPSRDVHVTFEACGWELSAGALRYIVFCSRDIWGLARASRAASISIILSYFVLVNVGSSFATLCPHKVFLVLIVSLVGNLSWALTETALFDTLRV